MIELKKIDQTKEVLFADNEVFLLRKSGIYNLNSQSSILGNFFCIRAWGKFLLTQSYDETNLLFLNHELEVVKEITGASNYALWLLSPCNLLPVEDKVFKLTDLLSLEGTKIEVFPKYCSGVYGVRRSRNSVICDNIKLNQDQWKFELGKDVKVVGEFLMFDNLVVVSTNQQELLGLELETGKELWRLEKINARFFQIQPNSNYLVSLNSNSTGDNEYFVINPFNGEILVSKKFESFYFDAQGNKACISKTHYYFISNVEGNGAGTGIERTTNFGCINLQTHELEWIERIGTTGSRRNEFQKPEINGNQVYLLDGEETLHIYEL